MAEHQDSPLTRALRDRLRDPDVLQKLRDVADDAEAAGEVSAARPARIRARVDDLEKEIAEPDEPS